MEVLLCERFKRPVCEHHPLRVRENAASLVNVDTYNHWEDIKDDMNGAYTKVLRCATWTVECQKGTDGLDFRVLTKKTVELTKPDQHHLVINSKGNKACPSLRKKEGFKVQNSEWSCLTAVSQIQGKIKSIFKWHCMGTVAKVQRHPSTRRPKGLYWL